MSEGVQIVNSSVRWLALCTGLLLLVFNRGALCPNRYLIVNSSLTKKCQTNKHFEH